MPRCAQCSHSLRGLHGVPSDRHGAFAAEVRCPECGAAYAAGARVLVGASSPLAPAHGRSLPARAWLHVLYGDGSFSAAMHALVALIPALGASEAMDILESGMRERYVEVVTLGALWLFALVWVARHWWKHLGASGHEAVRAASCDRSLVVHAAGVHDGGRLLPAETVRRIRVYECMAAGDGNTIVCVQAMARTKNGFFQLSRPVHAAVPAGSARRLASELMASLRGRSAPAEALGNELRGESTLPHPMLRGLRSTALAGVPIAILLAVLLHAGLGGFCFMFGVLPLFLFSTLASGACVSAWRPGPDGLEIADQGIVLRALSADGNIPTGPEVRHFCAYAALTRLELNEHRGMPFLVLHTRTSIDFRQPTGRFRARLVPDDFLGMEPESFARKVAERLRVPLRLQRTVRR